MSNANAQPLRVMIMAGGTGGHVFPALAVAAELRQRGVKVNWLGTARGIEAALVPAAGITLNLIRVEGVRGKGLIGLLKAPFLIGYAVSQALKILRQQQADVVLGFGGFASGPGGLAARLLRKPLVIHEQNAVAGTTNRLLSRIATKVLAAFAGVFADATVVGNPVRASIAELPSPAERYAKRAAQQAPVNLLVLGGSLGAKAINELLPQALALLPEEVRPKVWHQAGKNNIDVCRELYAQRQVEARLEPFIEDMSAAYAWADAVVCRAGALTVSELMAAGVAALLIPLPSAIDDHQTRNAAMLSDAGAGMSLAQKELTAERLATILQTHLSERVQLMAMAEKARQLALPKAAATVADICMEVARG